MEHFDLVERAFNELVAEGKVKRLPNDTPDLERKIEEQKAAITRRAAYYINTMRDANIGLLFKNWGNFVQDLAVDILFYKNGFEWDVASSDDREDGVIARIINASETNNGTDINRWRFPTREGAGLVPDVPPITDIPPVTIDLKLVRFMILAYNPVYVQKSEIESLVNDIMKKHSCDVYLVIHRRSDFDPIYCVQIVDLEEVGKNE